MSVYDIREIRKEDNKELATIIRSVLSEFAAPAEGTALQDPSLDQMFETYQGKKEIYFVAEAGGHLAGGCGVKELEGDRTGVCELQKMYLLSSARGRGIGKGLLEHCLAFAREAGYRGCYLETLPGMDRAYALYRKAGFVPVARRMGTTGHFSCDIWLYREL